MDLQSMMENNQPSLTADGKTRFEKNRGRRQKSRITES